MNVKQFSFASGELSPAIWARVDYSRYASGLKKCRNLPVMRHGGVVSRPGTQFIAEVADSANRVRLIPFIFNQQSGQTYLLEFSHFKVRFYQNGGQVVEAAVTITGATQANPCVVTAPGHGYSNGDEVVIAGIVGMTQLNGRNFLVANATANDFSLQTKNGVDLDSSGYSAYVSGGQAQRVYQVVSPYAQADIATIQFAQTGDVMTIVHPSYPPYELQRAGALSWSFVLIVFQSTATPPTNLASSGSTAGTINIQYTVTAVMPNGDETEASRAPVLVLNTIVNPTTAAPINLTWDAVAGAQSYRIYKQFGTVPSSGYIGTTSQASFGDTGISPDYSNQMPELVSLFAAIDDYPSTVGFVQQRRAFANSNNNPTTIWMSRAGSFANFSQHNVGTIPDDDPITFIPASEQVNQIQHIVELRQMLSLTAGCELWVQGDSAGIIRPTSINPQAQSYFGADSLKPIVVGDICIFLQARGWFVRDFGFDFSIDGYRGNDLTILAAHLFQGFTIVDWTYQQIPHSIIWATRSDGIVLGLTYLREQQILAWHKHDFSGGTVENVACVPESPEDGVYFSVKRTINGETKRYIERLSPFIWEDVIDATVLDSWLKYDGRSTSGITMTLSGGSTWAYTETLTLTADASFFTSTMVGDQIFLIDSQGNQIRCTISAFTSNTIVSVQPNKTVPASLQNNGTTDWSLAIQTITNLWTLEGQTVAVYADRFVVGSPNNPLVTSRYTVQNGQVILDKPYAVVYVGLPITSDLQTLDIDTVGGESMMDKNKFVSSVTAYVAQTRGFFAGTYDPDTNPLNSTEDPIFGLYEKKDQANRTTYDEPPELETNPVEVEIQADWNKNGSVFIRNVDPLPIQILSILPSGLLPGQVGNARV